MKNKTILLIISIIAITTCILSIVLLFNEKEIPQNIIKPNNNTIIQEKIVLEDDLEASNFRIKHNNNKWYLEIDFLNNSEEQKILKDYEVILYDSNNDYIKSIGIDTQIIIDALQKHSISLENSSDISDTKKIEIVKIN